MLIDGVILEQGPMNPPHAITLGLVEEAVRVAFGAGWWLRHQSPLILGQDTDPETISPLFRAGRATMQGIRRRRIW